MNHVKKLALTATAAGMMLAAAACFCWQYNDFAAAYWRGQLAVVPDAEADALLQRVAGLDEAGIPVLVEALGSQRAGVAKAANHWIDASLRDWEMCRPAVASTRLAILAEAMAARAVDFEPTARSRAARFAARILDWPLDPRTVDTSRLIADCEVVLRAAALDRKGEQIFAISPPAPTSSHDGDRHRTQEALLAAMSPLPGGGLPIASSSGRNSMTLEQNDRGRLAVKPASEPTSLANRAIPELEANPLRQSYQQLPDPQSDSVVQPAARRLLKPRQGPALQPWQAPVLATRDSVETPEMLETLETLDLMRAMHGVALPSGRVVEDADAREELLCRGFQTIHFALAQRLFDPDPTVRKELVTALPHMQTIDAVPWLMALAADVDPEVRLMAIGLLTTTADATLLEKLHAMALGDLDPRIQRQARRIGQQGSRTLH